MQKQKNGGVCFVLRSCCVLVFPFGKADADYSGAYSYNNRRLPFAQLRMEDIMKIVVVKSPRFLAGVLKLFFGIRKSGNT